VVLRVFFLVRLCVAFFAGFAEPASGSGFGSTFAVVAGVDAVDVVVLGAFVAVTFEPALVAAPGAFATLASGNVVVDDDEPAPLAEPALFEVAEPALGFAELEPLFVVVADPLPAFADVLGVDDRPSASKYAPAPASARSTSSTVTIRPMRRFGGSGIESAASLGFARCDVGFMLSAESGATPFLDCAGVGIGCAACGLLGPRCTLGVSGYDAGGTARSWLGVRCATWCAGVCTGCAPVSIFWVGGSGGASRAPQPPQNRESGSLSVPQLEQRIPP
jgi:hypothetical protein